MTADIAALDVPTDELKLRLLNARIADQLARPKKTQPASPGELAEQHHILYDADPDSAVPAFPYPTTGGAS